MLRIGKGEGNGGVQGHERQGMRAAAKQISPNQLVLFTSHQLNDLVELHKRTRPWAIDGPLRAVNNGQQRVAQPPLRPRSEAPASHGRRSSKLVMRVRFPSPARSWDTSARGEHSPSSLAISSGGATPRPRPAGFAPGPPSRGRWAIGWPLGHRAQSVGRAVFVLVTALSLVSS